MSPPVHEALAELVAARGEGVMTDPDQFGAALDDHLAESAAPAGTIYLLTDAVRLGALEALRSMVAAGAPAERAVEAAGERLARDRGSIEPAPALWACAALGYAVGVVPAAVVEGYDEPGTRSREEPAPATPTTPVAPVAPPTPPATPPATPTLAAHPLPPPLPAALPPPPAAYFAPQPYVPPDEGGRRIGPTLLIGALAVLVMVGVGTGTAYLLTRDNDPPPDRTSDSTRDDGTDDPTNPTDPTDATEATDATDATSGPTATVTVTEDGTDAEAALRDIIAADAATVSGLVGFWVPQLASISGGINGSWEAALTEYEELKSFFPDVVLLDAADWQHAFMPSETFDDVFVVLSPTPASPTSAPALDWCQLNRGDREASCYAKLIETSGSPRDNTDQNDPEPEYN